jgi:hypothetical protein
VNSMNRETDLKGCGLVAEIDFHMKSTTMKGSSALEEMKAGSRRVRGGYVDRKPC